MIFGLYPLQWNSAPLVNIFHIIFLTLDGFLSSHFALLANHSDFARARLWTACDFHASPFGAFLRVFRARLFPLGGSQIAGRLRSVFLGNRVATRAAWLAACSQSGHS